MDLLTHLRFTGPALPEPFVRFELERELAQRKLLPKSTGAEGERVQQAWEIYRRTLRELVAQGGALRVRNHVLEPLVSRLGYISLEPAPDVATREGLEAGGYLFVDGDGRRLRAWSTALAEDLDAPARRGHAYRYSHARIAQRVLLASGEPAGLLSNGIELRLLLSNPAGRDSEISIPIDPHWKRSRNAPDSYRLLLALASPAGMEAVPDLVEKARLQQTRVTKELRVQARQAVEQFVQEVLDHPANQALLSAQRGRPDLAAQLWREGLILVYRLLFILKLEASDDPAQAFGFASNSLWRNTYSPGVALAGFARAVLDEGAETGHLLEEGLRGLFRMFTEGVQASELHVKPLGGVLFGAEATPLLAQLRWSERAVAHLLDRLLWTPQRRGAGARQRVHYGPLDVKDLGRVYEALLELEPGVASEPMCRLRRQKLEVVVPEGQGARYQVSSVGDHVSDVRGEVSSVGDLDGEEVDGGAEDVEDEAGEDAPSSDTRHLTLDTSVQWIEAIPAGRFYLRVGLGRKSSGSFYTPDSFVTFLVQETLGPLVEQVSPKDDPRPLAILGLKALDNACGSGHFLVESDRFLGDKLYEACRLCDERALEAERRGEKARSAAERERLLAEAAAWRQRVADLPDPNDELVLYLPSRAPEGEESGLSQRKALALCKRLVAVHCLYGVDKNPLAVELARLALWIETQSEGLPLTFLDHRIVVGDSLTGPFFQHLLTLPGSQAPLEGLYSQGLSERFSAALRSALAHVADLEASIGVSAAETEAKQAAKARLDRALAPFRIVAAAWAGGVMLGPACCDDEGYLALAGRVAESGDLPADLTGQEAVQAMIARGLGVDAIPAERDALLALLASGQCVPALPFELAFPEVFYPTGDLADRRGFHVTLGNPPWDRLLPADKEFFAAYDFSIMDAPTKRERDQAQRRLLANADVRRCYDAYVGEFRAYERIRDATYQHQVAIIDGNRTIGKQDAFRLFMERNAQLLAPEGVTGVVVPSAFHANEGATGVRKLYLEEMGLEHCYSFENRRKLFEIHSSFKFALVIARRQGPTGQFNCAFYLHDDEWLFGERSERALTYTLRFVKQTGGEYLSLLELRSTADYQVARVCYQVPESFGEMCERLGIRLGRELNMTDDAWRFTAADQVLASEDDVRDPEIARQMLNKGYLGLHEGKTFWHYDDRWEDPPRYLVLLSNLVDKPMYSSRARFFRFAYRTVASSTNERTAVSCILPAGITCGHSVGIEQEAEQRRTFSAAALEAITNSFTFDWCLRLMVGSNVTQYQLFATPTPKCDQITRYLAHNATRLTCNHAGYAPLWREQLGDTWREATPPFTWPVLAGDDARWAVRAAIDAVVAQAYGLDRAQYAHVLSTFSHKSYPQAPALCLARFDELTAIGPDAFTKRWDPYWDVPLNESLPVAVIELPVVASVGSQEQQMRLQL